MLCMQVGGFEAYLLADEGSTVEAAEAYRAVSERALLLCLCSMVQCAIACLLCLWPWAAGVPFNTCWASFLQAMLGQLARSRAALSQSSWPAHG